MTPSPSPGPVNAKPLQSPVRRNRVWWTLQVIAQSFAAAWMRYQARGVEHLPTQTGALLLINHRSFVDPILAGLAIDRPVSFVARHNLFDVPLFGPLFRHNYVIPINRDAAGTTSLREIVRRLEHGFLVGLFPEGTRHAGPAPLGPLKPGFVSILRRVNVPIIPVGIAGAGRVMPRKAIFIRPRPVRVVIGERISPGLLSELTARGRERELLELVAARMSAAVIDAEEWLKESLRSGQKK